MYNIELISKLRSVIMYIQRGARMYKPIQIPHLLNTAFSNTIHYTEIYPDELNDFLICFWQMTPKKKDIVTTVTNVIVADGCIDLVVDFNNKKISFTGMSKTEFNFIIKLPSYFFGARLKPGAFYYLSGIPATRAMDFYIPISDIFQDFDEKTFFTLSIKEAKIYFENYLAKKILALEPKPYVSLFDNIFKNPPQNIEALAYTLGYSKRQLQRLCQKYFGLTPQMILNIIRFQKALDILITKKTRPTNLITLTNYYDQPHFNRDFKEKIGITPNELLQMYEE